jgi:hypothetical protein
MQHNSRAQARLRVAVATAAAGAVRQPARFWVAMHAAAAGTRSKLGC